MEVISAQSWHDSHVTYDGHPTWVGKQLIGWRLLPQVLGTAWTTFFYHRGNVNS